MPPCRAGRHRIRPPGPGPWCGHDRPSPAPRNDRCRPRPRRSPSVSWSSTPPARSRDPKPTIRRVGPGAEVRLRQRPFRAPGRTRSHRHRRPSPRRSPRLLPSLRLRHATMRRPDRPSPHLQSPQPRHDAQRRPVRSRSSRRRSAPAHGQRPEWRNRWPRRRRARPHGSRHPSPIPRVPGRRLLRRPSVGRRRYRVLALPWQVRHPASRAPRRRRSTRYRRSAGARGSHPRRCRARLDPQRRRCGLDPPWTSHPSSVSGGDRCRRLR